MTDQNTTSWYGLTGIPGISWYNVCWASIRQTISYMPAIRIIIMISTHATALKHETHGEQLISDLIRGISRFTICLECLQGI